MDAQTATDDIFRLLNEAPEALLQVQWVALDERIESLLDQERRIAAERDELTKQQNVLTAIAKYRGIELSRAARNAAVHGRPNPNTSAPKQAVQLLLDEGPDATWDARSVHDAITDAGVETSRENVRIILQRLAKDGSIRRVAHGRYQSALAPGEHTLLEDDESKEGDVREPLLR